MSNQINQVFKDFEFLTNKPLIYPLLEFLSAYGDMTVEEYLMQENEKIIQVCEF